MLARSDENGQFFAPGKPDFIDVTFALVEEYDRNFAKFAVGLDAVRDLLVEANLMLGPWEKVVADFADALNIACGTPVTQSLGFFHVFVDEEVARLSKYGMCEVDIAQFLDLFGRMKPYYGPMRKYDSRLEALLSNIYDVTNRAGGPRTAGSIDAGVNDTLAAAQNVRVECADMYEVFPSFVFALKCV